MGLPEESRDRPKPRSSATLPRTTQSQGSPKGVVRVEQLQSFFKANPVESFQKKTSSGPKVALPGDAKPPSGANFGRIGRGRKMTNANLPPSTANGAPQKSYFSGAGAMRPSFSGPPFLGELPPPEPTAGEESGDDLPPRRVQTFERGADGLIDFSNVLVNYKKRKLSVLDKEFPLPELAPRSLPLAGKHPAATKISEGVRVVVRKWNGTPGQEEASVKKSRFDGWPPDLPRTGSHGSPFPEIDIFRPPDNNGNGPQNDSSDADNEEDGENNKNGGPKRRKRNKAGGAARTSMILDRIDGGSFGDNVGQLQSVEGNKNGGPGGNNNGPKNINPGIQIGDRGGNNNRPKKGNPGIQIGDRGGNNNGPKKGNPGIQIGGRGGIKKGGKKGPTQKVNINHDAEAQKTMFSVFSLGYKSHPTQKGRAIPDHVPLRWFPAPHDTPFLPHDIAPVEPYKRRYGKAREAMGMINNSGIVVSLQNLSLKVVVDNIRLIDSFEGMPEACIDLILEEAVEKSDFFDRPSDELELMLTKMSKQCPQVLPTYLEISNLFVLNDFYDCYVAMFPALVELELRDINLERHEIWVHMGHHATKLETLNITNCIFDDEDLRKLAIAISVVRKKDPNAFKAMKRLILTGTDINVVKVLRLFNLLPGLEKVVYQLGSTGGFEYESDEEIQDAIGTNYANLETIKGHGWDMFKRKVPRSMIGPATDNIRNHLGPICSKAQTQAWSCPLYDVFANKWVPRRVTLATVAQPKGYDACLTATELHVMTKDHTFSSHMAELDDN